MYSLFKEKYTIFEIFLGVCIVCVLVGVVVFVLNPDAHTAQRRNAQRNADVNIILEALYQYAIDNDGNFPITIDETYDSVQIVGSEVSQNTSQCGIQTTSSVIDLSSDLVPMYLASIPEDPSHGSRENTYYYVNRDKQGRLEVGACEPEAGVIIKVVR